MAELPTEASEYREDETVVFGAVGDSNPNRRPIATPPEEYAFLEPPKAEGELGRLANYRVIKVIGSGGMGLVFLAEDGDLKRAVALKVIRPEIAGRAESLARFNREARIAAAIKHDNIVTIYQVGQASGVPFLAMELLSGIAMQDWLDRGHQPSLGLALRFARETATGLAAAHRLGLIHRDIKPANLWLEKPNGRVKILDFGQARAEHEDAQITHAGTIMGTPSYMSPEQAAGDATDLQTDLYSLGCVMYRLTTGRLPFEGKNVIAVLQALATMTPMPPRDLNVQIPPTLSDLIMRLLAKNRKDRPASAQEVVNEIRIIERQLTAVEKTIVLSTSSLPQISVPSTLISGKPVPALAASRFSLSKTTLILGMAGVAIIAFALGTFVMNRGRSRGERPPQPTWNADARQRPSGDFSKKEDHPDVVPPRAASMEPPPKPPEIVKREQPPKPPAIPVAPAVPKALEKQRVEFGTPQNPAGDCEITLNAETGLATMRVPGIPPHLLSADLVGTTVPPQEKRPGTKAKKASPLAPQAIDYMNAPRVLKRIEGDFTASVRVSGTSNPDGARVTKQFAPYHGGGFLLWQSPTHYVRMEVASQVEKTGQIRHFINYQYRRNGEFFEIGPYVPADVNEIRVTREGDQLLAAYRSPGAEWTALAPLKITLTSEIEIGLTAINSSSRELFITFDQYNVVPKVSR